VECTGQTLGNGDSHERWVNGEAKRMGGAADSGRWQPSDSGRR
jgi:hypothetical protein